MSGWLGGRSGRFRFDLARQLAEKDFLQFDLVARVIHIDAHEPPLGVVVQHDAFRDFPAISARAVAQFDVQRVRIGVVVEFDGLNLRSGKALWIVILCLQRHHPQVPAIQFGNCGPKPPPIGLLRLGMDGVFDHEDAPRDRKSVV